jgi:hypothetical protein
MNEVADALSRDRKHNARSIAFANAATSHPDDER